MWFVIVLVDMSDNCKSEVSETDEETPFVECSRDEGSDECGKGEDEKRDDTDRVNDMSHDS